MKSMTCFIYGSWETSDKTLHTQNLQKEAISRSNSSVTDLSRFSPYLANSKESTFLIFRDSTIFGEGLCIRFTQHRRHLIDSVKTPVNLNEVHKIYDTGGGLHETP